MAARHLITTADERTWVFDRPVLFLGEWCRTYGRRSLWEGMDGEVAAPYGLTAAQQNRDLSYVHGLADRLLPELTAALNATHGTRHSIRYWEMLVGYWLQYYTAVAFNRYVTLERAFEDHEINATTVLDVPGHPLAQPDATAFVQSCNAPVFNHLFYASVLRFQGFDAVRTVAAAAGPAADDDRPPRAPSAQTPAGLSLKRRLLQAARRVSPMLARSRDAFVLNTYLPAAHEAGLQIALGQWPHFWESPRPGHAAPDALTRERFTIDPGQHTGFERYVRLQLPAALPTCHLEGYHAIVEQARHLPWPSRPRFIFTSNNFSVDEVFKAWAAAKVEEGVPYFVGQHGANYGTLRGHLHCPEISTADRFVTWGWTSRDPKTVPAFVFTLAGKPERSQASCNGGLLLVELPLQWCRTPWDAYFEFAVYQEEQFRFVEALPESIRASLTVRLHRDYREMDWSDDERWNERCPRVRVEKGGARIRTLIGQSRLVVHSYDSTGVLEGLATNTPTLCFWHGGVEHVVADARPYYEQLVRAGILHETPEGAANGITAHWDSIDRWWNGREVQQARRAFCDRFARTSAQPVRTLKRLLVAEAEACAAKARHGERMSATT